MDAEIIQLEQDQDSTPYLSVQLTATPIWQVTIQNYLIDLPSADADSAVGRRAKTFDVFLDPTNARLLKAVSRWPGDVPEAELPPEPDATTSAEQRFRAGREVYHGFPRDGPPITLPQALDAIYKGGGNPLAAGRIKAQYVTWSRLDGDSKDVWVVTLRGGPSRLAGYPDGRGSHWRYIVDPQAKRLRCATNTPHGEQ